MAEVELVDTSDCHSEDSGFEPRRSRQPDTDAFIASRDTQTMPPRGVSWEERAAIISLAKLLDFRSGVLPKITSYNSPQGRGLRCV